VKRTTRLRGKGGRTWRRLTEGTKDGSPFPVELRGRRYWEKGQERRIGKEGFLTRRRMYGGSGPGERNSRKKEIDEQHDLPRRGFGQVERQAISVIKRPQGWGKRL